MSVPKTAYLALVRVRFNECDPMGHVNNAVYLNYLEQVAIDHAAAIGWNAESLTDIANALFVARKHEITYHRPAFENDYLLIRTWPTGFSGARGIRSYTVSRFSGDHQAWHDKLVSFHDLPDIAREDLIVSATTEWAFMNVSTGRPARIPQSVLNDFMETL